MSRQLLLVFMLAIILAAGIAAFFIFGSQKAERPAPPTSQLPVDRDDREIGGATPEIATLPGGQADAIQKQKEQKRPAVIEFFGSTIQLPPLVAEELLPFLKIPGKIPASAGLNEEEPQKTAQARQSPEAVLAPDEVFRILYPDFYRSALEKVQNVLVDLNVIPGTQKFSFQDENDILEFNDIFFDYLKAKKAISEADYQSYREGRNFLFNRPYDEKYREALQILEFQQQAGAAEAKFLSAPEEVVAPPSFELLPEAVGARTGKELRDKIGIFLRNIGLLPREVQAITVNVAGVLCFRSGGKGGGVGVNFPTPCCRCSIKKIPVGCLDICPVSAIWDPLTKMCGCNAGGSGGATY